VDKVTLGQVSSEYFGFRCKFSFHELLRTHLSSGAGIIGQIVADVPSGLSLTAPREITGSSDVSCGVNQFLFWTENGLSFFVVCLFHSRIPRYYSEVQDRFLSVFFQVSMHNLIQHHETINSIVKCHEVLINKEIKTRSSPHVVRVVCHQLSF
jgi:hypothetical protein